jgi:hypothetical protein
MMSFHDSLCRREFFDLAALLCPVVPSLLSCPLLVPFVPLGCGEFASSVAGDTPFTAASASREYWLRPRRPRDFCGGRPPRRGVGAGLEVSISTSGGADAEMGAGATGSSVGVGVASGGSDSALLSVGLANMLMSLPYRLPFSVQLALCVCWLPQCVPARVLSLSVPFLVGSLQLRRVVSASVRKLLYCHLLTR